MPLYFAYGANMDQDAMRRRCWRSVPIGVGRLPAHDFLVTACGYGSVHPARGRAVHGLVWHLDFRDIAALDRYESVETGL